MGGGFFLTKGSIFWLKYGSFVYPDEILVSLLKMKRLWVGGVFEIQGRQIFPLNGI